MEKITLKAARINKGLSAKKAAQFAGITEDTLYRYEAGKGSPKIEVALKLAEAYGVSINVIDFSVPTGSEKTN